MKRMILAFILTSFFIGPAINAAPFIYGVNSGEGAMYHLTIVDIASSSSIYQTIIAPDPTAIQLTPDNNYAYIAFGDSVPYFSTIQVFDTFTQTFSSFTLGTRNLMMVITPDGAYGYTTTASNHLNAFEIPSNNTHPNIITLPNILNSNGIAVTADQHYLYVTDAGSNTVQIVDISNPLAPMIATPVGSFTVGTSGTHLAGIAITSDGSTAYVVSSNANEVYQVTGLPSSPTAGIIIPVNGYPGVSGSAIPIVLTGDNETAYVGIKNVSISSLGSLVIINDLTTTPVTTFIAGPSFFTVPALAISKDGKYVAAATEGLGIIKTADNSFVVVETTLLYDAVSITANPNPPTNVQGCAMPLLNDYTIVLTWDPPAYDPSPVPAPFQYNIYSDPALTTLVGTVPATDPLTFSISGLSPTQTYTFYIVTVDQLGDISTPVAVTVAPYETCYPEVLPPSSATGCVIPMGSTVDNFISWTAPSSGPTPAQYQIFYDAGLTQLVATVDGDVFSYEDMGVSSSINTYYIISVDQYGDISAPIGITITNTCYPTVLPPSSITGCFFIVYGITTNVISWTPPAYGPTPVQYQIFHDAGLTDLVAAVPGDVFSYDDTPPTSNTYYVVSVDQYGDFSAPINITITDPCYPSPYVQPDPPTNVIGKLRCNIFFDRNERILKISWTASDSADVVSYNIYNGSTLVGNILATRPLCFITALGRCDNGKNFSIAAVDSNGNESVDVPVTIM